MNDCNLDSSNKTIIFRDVDNYLDDDLIFTSRVFLTTHVSQLIVF